MGTGILLQKSGVSELGRLGLGVLEFRVDLNPKESTFLEALQKEIITRNPKKVGSLGVQGGV